MSDEKKYDVQGTVTISTEEYRDLITSSITNEKEASEYRSKCWKYESKIKELEEKVAAQEKAISHYKDFVNQSDDRMQAYKVFLVDKEEAE